MFFLVKKYKEEERCGIENPSKKYKMEQIKINCVKKKQKINTPKLKTKVDLRNWFNHETKKKLGV